MSVLHRVGTLPASTPAGRDRTLDALRGGALAVVVVAHWVMAVAWLGPDGLRVGNALALAPWLQPLTWLLQVMPLFFLVGGHVNADGWRAARRRGVEARVWVRRRAARLLAPTVPLVVLWAVVAPAAVTVGVDAGLVRAGAQAALVPLWFLAVYLVISAATPLAVALHDRHGLAVPVWLGTAAAVVDVVHLAGVPGVGWVNFLLVWGVAHQLGVAWADGRLSSELAWGLLAVGMLAMIALVTLVGYPLSLVGVDGAARSNTAPPSLLLVALSMTQAGGVALLRRRIDRLLARPRVWRVVALLAAVAMPLYLWHLTVAVVAIGALAAAGFGEVLAPGGPLSALWWMTRPAWVLALAALASPLVVAAFRRGVGRELPVSTPSAAVVAAAIAAGSAGIALVIVGGLHGMRPGFAGVALLLWATRILAGGTSRTHTASHDGARDRRSC